MHYYYSINFCFPCNHYQNRKRSMQDFIAVVSNIPSNHSFKISCISHQCPVHRLLILQQYSAWASSQPKCINPSRNCYHPIYKNAISNFWAGLHRGAPGPQLVKIFFCVSLVDCVGHFHMCCVSSNCPHLGHEVVSCSFHLTRNLLTPHMPAVCFEM